MAHTPQQGRPVVLFRARGGLVLVHHWLMMVLLVMLAFVQFTQPPARYTEATLIRAMEEKGIGRPSTYAPTISSITARDYVIKEGKYLKPTPLGQVVTSLMKERFADIVDLKFTNQMESELDEIESGKAEWRSVLENFYGGFSKELHEAEEALDGVRLKVPDILSDEYCDVCGRQMVVKKGTPSAEAASSSAPARRAMSSTPASAAPTAASSPGMCPPRTSAPSAARPCSSTAAGDRSNPSASTRNARTLFQRTSGRIRKRPLKKRRKPRRKRPRRRLPQRKRKLPQPPKRERP